MNYKSSALLVLLLAVGLAYLALYLDVLPAALKICLGVLVVLFLPGYLLSEIFFPYLRSVQRLTLSLGLSSVFILLLGFGLHLAGFGLVQEMWLAGSRRRCTCQARVRFTAASCCGKCVTKCAAMKKRFARV